jgi:DnaJ like chaperone protein
MELLIFVAVVAVFYFLNRNYDGNDYQHIKVNVRQQLKGDLAEHEAGLLIAMMAKVAKADGNVCELEAELLSNIFTDISLVFENDAEIRVQLKEIYKKEKESFDNTIVISQKYLKLTKRDYNKRLKVMEYLLNLAFIDGDFSETENMIIEDIANAIEIKRQDLDEMVGRFKVYYENMKNHAAMSVDKAYETLEMPKDATDNELKKQYRKLVKKYHPDVVTGQGAEQSIIDEATNKLQEINEAYELIKKDRGL